ncbi:MAG: Lrp/AsnC family transcriptional regulator [Gemmatimonadales bacterium]|nr:Lrp/AsnC family transcriptional regulator [Gemmatimonadales bacterium]
MADLLDPTTRHLLRLLAANGRVSYQALADQVGLSRPAVMERVKRLEESGYITGYAARLDRAKSGYPITAFVAVRYGAAAHAAEAAAIGALEASPNVLECHHVAGEDCYIVKVAATSLESLEGVLRTLRGSDRSVTTRTTIVLSTVFEKPGVVPAELD